MDDRPREGTVRPTGWRPLLVLAVAGAAVGYLVMDRTYGTFAMVPWTAIPTLSLLALGEGVTAVQTRRRIRRVPGTTPIAPISAARLVALAKASALFGALAIGVFGGAALALVDRLAVPAPRADAITCAGTMLAGVLLLAAALFLEYACRVPGDQDPPTPPDHVA
ncbi:DUF3180 domain-containing protein [Nocardiopsis trehalosi]|jgi:hypothetical protein|uniref:DUF3180 domain-containing protein n=1 Tax=Nocardiopsis trehalosi TaxID=109329 RepID=UPI000833281C|nr:DUF3180 domain-containing protein [Nocardiopsis trehalosi]